MNSPRRFVVLDGMRGVAAAAVLVHHAAPTAFGRALLPRGYLAVDFFFMLSGFVMARTYEPRLAAGLGARAFLAARVRRLYPVMAAGIVLGAVAVMARGGSPLDTMGVLATELLFLPTLSAGMAGVFFLDGVEWSLLFELFANAVHAWLLRRMPARTLMWVALGLLLALAIVAGRWGGLAVGDRGFNFAGGVPRVLFSYTVGIVLARRAWPRPNRGGSGVPPMILLAAAIAGAGLTPDAWPHWIVDLPIAALAFPALIVLGARAEASPAAARAMDAAGALSFPLYAVHLPAMSLTMMLAGDALGTGPALFALCVTVALAAAAGVQALVAPRRSPAAADGQATSRASIAANLVDSTPSTSAA